MNLASLHARAIPRTLNSRRAPASRRGLAAGLLLAAVVVAGGVGAPDASAHPLGNFTVNHHTGLTLHTDRVDAVLVVDRAEIAAAQELPGVDRDGSGTVSGAEAGRYARTACANAAEGLRVDDGGTPLGFSVRGSGFTLHPGEAGLRTSRLRCALSAPADLRRPADLTVRTAYDSRRIGWQEITARGSGVTLTASDVPAVSATDELRRYPADPLASPLDQRSADLRTAPGGPGGGTAGAARPGADWVPGPVTAVLDKVTGAFDSLVGTRELTVPVGLLALLLAVVLGASHAAMPGHGKTIMAAYLAGRRGTPRDAVTVGATVTLTHTAGVLTLGLLLPVATTLAGETVLTWLGLASGLLVTGIGLWLLRSAVRGEPTHGHHHHGHGEHGHEHGHHQGHPHPHPETRPHPEPHPEQPADSGPSPVAVLTPVHTGPHTHTHDHPQPHTHAHAHPRPATATRGGLIGMGIAGGLVPSPSALVVLLGAVALGRTAFGVLLVLAYGLGMAGTLTLAGLLLVRLRDHVERRTRTATAARWKRLRRLARWGPVATSALVLLVGIGLTLRAVAGPW
ncbi:sulfite exporter TauE/SafE family protein [Streptomyces sp. NBC_01498]|uniref:nickel/cobalt transporter n=1 Tax=Streptomyces sp. NBC_01498 TaxID=2975870 RepID=UPI002E7B3626|nr:sulfite exporter TauE/SafE family protein [Streptomyces sp. NBC_01498]WTL25686.1 sulfite exporter TauE/SafE family protein [Streptomyces sp. NBC_01498]